MEGTTLRISEQIPEMSAGKETDSWHFYFTSSLAPQHSAEICELRERQTKKIPLTVLSSEINNNNFHELQSFT